MHQLALRQRCGPLCWRDRCVQVSGKSPKGHRPQCLEATWRPLTGLQQAWQVRTWPISTTDPTESKPESDRF